MEDPPVGFDHDIGYTDEKGFFIQLAYTNYIGDYFNWGTALRSNSRSNSTISGYAGITIPSPLRKEEKDKEKEVEGWRDSALLDEKDKIVLQYTEEVVTDSRPNDETFEAASKFLDDTSLVELTLSIGYWSMVGKFLKTFMVDVEPHFMVAHKELLEFTGMVDL